MGIDSTAEDVPRPQSVAEVLKDGSPGMRLAESFTAAGHEIYIVGGPVRDALLGRVTEDLDFATDAEPEETLTLVRPMAENVWLQGARFGTVGADIDGHRMEITTFRTEKYQPSSRHPEVTFASDIKTDLSRRDFTVNAMAIKLPERTSLDPFGGIEDLKKKVLRTPGDPHDSFGDDPLRMLRAFRFASQLEFKIDPSARAAIADMRDELGTISAERIRDELSKLLIGARPGRALEQAEAVGLTQLFLPELSSLKLEQDPVHRHKDVFHHTLAVVERTPPRLIPRLGALLHDIGKPKTRRIGPEGVSFHHHEVVGADMAKKRLRELRFPNGDVDAVFEIIRLHHRFHTYRLGWSDSAVRRYVRDAGPHLEDLNTLVRADCTTRNAAKARELQGRMDELEERIAELAVLEELDKIRPELDGNQVMRFLNLPPGPEVGRALAFLLEIRLEEGIIGEEAAFERLAAWAKEQGIEPGPRP
ncbi:MAG TPA: CCA tRNA nucleotidyltransferase [Actinomycetota bacterium]|nr:CCA tRNA nucleotidyltransferase [Actinomycetota bacterium]